MSEYLGISLVIMDPGNTRVFAVLGIFDVSFIIAKFGLSAIWPV